jgi:hypothetical protein
MPLDENDITVSYDNKKRDFDSKEYKKHAEGRKKNRKQ